MEYLKLSTTSKNIKSTDDYDIDKRILRIVKHVPKPFTHKCNKSFESSVFPDKMYLAKVVPIFKSGEKNRPTNYSPASLMPQFSKVLEEMKDLSGILKNMTY